MLSNLAAKLQYLVEKGTSKQKNFLVFSLFLPAIILRLYHVITYPVSFGYDASWHLAYILKLASTWTIPSAYENLESYQPPLYYFISACFTAIIGIENHVYVKICLKLINCFYGLIMLFFIYKALSLISRTFFNNNRIIVLCGTLLAFYLPVHIYISPMISNEMLCACLVTIGLYILTFCVIKKSFSKKSAVILGIITGLGLLTKYTNFLFLITFLIVSAVIFFDKKINRKELAVFVVIVLSLVSAISGWWYIRNAVKYGDPLIKSNDLQKFSDTYSNQPPGSHSLNDFFIFDFRVFSQPFLAIDGRSEKLWNNYKKNNFMIFYNDIFNSVITGTFSTIWIENHGIFLNTKGCFTLSRVLLIPGFLIFLLAVSGFLKSCFDMFRTNIFTGLMPMVILLTVSLAAYIGYNIKYPYFFHVKAFFMLHLACPFILFFSYALNIMLKKSKILFNLFIILLLFTVLLVTLIYAFFSF